MTKQEPVPSLAEPRQSMPGEDSIGETCQCDACIEIRKKIAINPMKRGV